MEIRALYMLVTELFDKADRKIATYNHYELEIWANDVVRFSHEYKVLKSWCHPEMTNNRSFVIYGS